MLEKQRCIAAPVMEHNAVVVDRSIHDGHCRLLFIRHGRLIDTLKCALPATAIQKKEIKVQLVKHFDAGDTDRPDRYFKAEIEEIRLLANWLYVNREASEKVDWQKGNTVSSMLEQIWRKVRKKGPGVRKIRES